MTPARLLHLEFLGFLYSLIAVIGYQLFTRQINVRGLLLQKTGRRNGPERVSPGRIQLLLATIAASASFLNAVASSKDGKMPDFDPHWLYVLGASSGIYTLEKAFAAWSSTRSRKS